MTVPSGSTLVKNFRDSGWMTNANRLLRRGPFGWSRRGSRPAVRMISSRSSSRSRSGAPPGARTVARIIASRVATSMVTS